MILIEKTQTLGWEEAIRGMRNPLESWKNSDSHYAEMPDDDIFIVGDNDYELMKKLVKAGSDHSKFMRMISVYCDITAPLFWWKEADTYKVGTVRNSCSTMHKLASKPITTNDFSCETCAEDDDIWCEFGLRVEACEAVRKKFNETGDKRYWRMLIEMLPESYNQRSTVMLNYAVLRNMYHARKNHKLKEWHDFCEWIEGLPYSELITME